MRRQVEWREALRGKLLRESAPEGLKARLKIALDEEPVPLASWRRWAMRTMPLAVAAGVLMVALVGRTTWRVDEVAADAVSKHKRNLPVEVTGLDAPVLDVDTRERTAERRCDPARIEGPLLDDDLAVLHPLPVASESDHRRLGHVREVTRNQLLEAVRLPQSTGGRVGPPHRLLGDIEDPDRRLQRLE